MGLDDYEEQEAEEPKNFAWVNVVGIIVGVAGAFFGKDKALSKVCGCFLSKTMKFFLQLCPSVAC